jgi:hypothetical protein
MKRAFISLSGLPLLLAACQPLGGSDPLDSAEAAMPVTSSRYEDERQWNDDRMQRYADDVGPTIPLSTTTGVDE